MAASYSIPKTTKETITLVFTNGGNPAAPPPAGNTPTISFNPATTAQAGMMASFVDDTHVVVQDAGSQTPDGFSQTMSISYLGLFSMNTTVVSDAAPLPPAQAGAFGVGVNSPV